MPSKKSCDTGLHIARKIGASEATFDLLRGARIVGERLTPAGRAILDKEKQG